MKALEILIEEHRLIRQALESLSLALEKLEYGEPIPQEFFLKWFDLYRSFILNFHHFKEEHVMFRHLAGKKNGMLDAQIEVLRHQHERGRDFITDAEHAMAGYAKGEEIQTSTLLENLAAYISLLRHHIHREEHVFYPLVQKEFSEAEHAAVLEEFEKEHKKAGARVHDDARTLVREMGTILER